MPERRPFVTKDQPVSGVRIPTSEGPTTYGTPESADALSSVWGMSPPRAQAIMGLEQGTMTPDEYDEMMRQIQIAENVERMGKLETIHKRLGNFTPKR